MPYPRPNEIVQVSLEWKDGTLNDTLTGPEFEFYRDHSGAFAVVAGFRGGGEVSIKRGNGNEWVKSLRVTDGFFPVLGVHPAIGRGILREEDRPGGAQVAILSDSLWRNLFGADPAVIGRQLEMNDNVYTVVGVMPPSFTFVEQPADVFIPLQLGSGIEDTGMNTRVIARLASGTSPAPAQANIDVVFDQFRRQGSAQSGRRGIQLESYQKWLAGDLRISLLVLFGAVGFLLLIACANVASLIMARTSARQREVSIRLALGADRWQMLRQFLSESLMLAVVGSAAGLLAAGWALKALVASIPWDIPSSASIALDSRVLAFSLLLAVATTLIFGFTSYWQASKLDLNDTLKAGVTRGAAGTPHNRMRSVLVVGEAALSLMLLVGAGLLIDTLYYLHTSKSWDLTPATCTLWPHRLHRRLSSPRPRSGISSRRCFAASDWRRAWFRPRRSISSRCQDPTICRLSRRGVLSIALAAWNTGPSRRIISRPCAFPSSRDEASR